jgi:hypothetical protein
MNEPEQPEDETTEECPEDKEHAQAHETFTAELDRLCLESVQSGGLSVNCVIVEILSLVVQTSLDNDFTKDDLQKEVSSLYDHLLESRKQQLNG